MRAKGVFSPLHVRPDEADHIYRRFSFFDIVLHLTMMVTFLGLVLTGLPLKFSHAPWASGLMHFLGEARMAGLIHRICAAITFAYFGTTIAYIFDFLFFKKIRGSPNPLQRLFGPDSLCPRWKDIQDIMGIIRWFFNNGPKPRFDRWTYWEKFDFLAVFWGMFAIGFSGLMLWFQNSLPSFYPSGFSTLPRSFTRMRRSWLLASSHRPFLQHPFPTFKVPNRYRDLHREVPEIQADGGKEEQYHRLLAERGLETDRDKYPSVGTDLFSGMMGFAMLAIGLLGVFLIAWEVSV